MNILVVGGAGYIGSHNVHALCERGDSVVVLDSLVTGHLEAVHHKAKFYLGDILGVCFTSSDDFVTSLEEYYHLNGDKIVPFPTRICYDGRRYYMEDIT